jgi:hypothetical protein
MHVVTQGVNKILIKTMDDLSTPEEQMILNLSQERGELKIGAMYCITIEEED